MSIVSLAYLKPVSATAEFVLMSLNNLYRLQCAHDPEAEPDMLLSFDSTVAEWRLACDLTQWRTLAHSLNQFWAIRASDEQWHAVLEPAKQRTLRDVCHFIALYGRRFDILPCRFLGKVSYQAGAFLAIKGLLAENGVDVSQLRPSSSLLPYLQQKTACSVLMNQLCLISSNPLPLIHFAKIPISKTTIIAFTVMAILPAILALFMTLPTKGTLLLYYLTVILLCWLMNRYLYHHRLNSQPAETLTTHWGQLSTFADLAGALTNTTAPQK